MKWSVSHYCCMAKRARHTLELRAWVHRTKKKQKALAQHIGVGQPYISLLVKGERDNPEIDKIFGMSEFFQVPVEALFQKPPKSDRALERMRELWRLQRDLRDLES